MKKHRKLLALLVALTFLFSAIAPVMAAPVAEENAAGTLVALGIIEGDASGDLMLDKDITRAEFAKIAIMAKGLGDAEPLMKGTPSQFSDVANDAWYNGWVNLAASQGFIQGYGDGNFGPNDKVTYSQAITILLRLLGYNDNLPGAWPSNYLTKAISLGITKGVDIGAYDNAVRGPVFALTEKALNTPMVEWKKSDEVFVEKTVKDSAGNDVVVKLVSDSFKGTMSEGLVTNVSWNKGVASLNINVTTKTGFNPRSFSLAKNAVIVGADDVVALLANRVDFVLNDDDEITYVGTKKTDSWPSPSGYTMHAGSQIWLGGAPGNVPDSMKFDWADVTQKGVTYFPSQGGLDDLSTPGNMIAAGQATVVGVKDSKGKIEHVFVYKYTGANLIDEIYGNKIYFKNGGSYEKGSSDQVVVIRNGEVASFSDLQEGDLFYKFDGSSRGVAAILVASDEVKRGVLEGATSEFKKLTIGNDTYSVETSEVLVSTNNGKTFVQSANIDKNVFDNEVEFMLSPTGKIVVLISDVKASTSLYGVIDVVDGTITDLNGVKARILTADGKKVVYTVVGDPAKGASPAIKGVEGQLVRYYLNKDGEINNYDVSTSGSVGVDKAKANRIQVGSTWYSVGDTAVLFGQNADTPPASIKTNWEGVKGTATAGVGIEYFLDRNGDVVVAAYYKALVSSAGTDIAVITDKGYTSKGFYYDFLVKGQKVTYFTDTDAEKIYKKDSEDKKYAAGDAVKITLASGKVSSLTSPLAATVVGKVYRVNGDQLVIGAVTSGSAGNYYITKDTVIVEKASVMGSSVYRVADRVNRDNEVKIFVNATDPSAIDLIIITK